MKVGFLFLLAAQALLSGTLGLTCQDAVAAIVRKEFKAEDGNGNNYVTFNDDASIVEDIDSDDDGVITPTEFRKAYTKLYPESVVLTPLYMREMDINKDNKLTNMEVMEFVKPVDADGNGRVTPEEYRKFWIPLLTRLFKEAGETPRNCTW